MRFVAGADCGDCGGVPIPVTYQTAPSNYHVVAASSSTIDLSVYPYNFNYTEAGCGCDADATDVDWYSNFYSTYTSGCETTVSMKKKWWCLNDCDAHSDDDNMVRVCVRVYISCVVCPCIARACVRVCVCVVTLTSGCVFNSAQSAHPVLLQAQEPHL